MKVAKSSRSGIEIYNGEVALLQIEVMITSLKVALSKNICIFFCTRALCEVAISNAHLNIWNATSQKVMLLHKK